LNQGTFSIRFQDLGTTAPRIVSYQVVKNGQLSTVLPADSFIPADQPNYREDQIAARQDGFNNRFLPFLQT
jgi:hypothetical protein